MNPWEMVALFVVGCVTDWFWTRWTLAVASKRALPGALWAFLVCTPTVLTVNAYVRSPLYLVPFASGCAVGTWLTIVRSRRDPR